MGLKWPELAPLGLCRPFVQFTPSPHASNVLFQPRCPAIWQSRMSYKRRMRQSDREAVMVAVLSLPPSTVTTGHHAPPHLTPRAPQQGGVHGGYAQLEHHAPHGGLVRGHGACGWGGLGGPSLAWLHLDFTKRPPAYAFPGRPPPPFPPHFGCNLGWAAPAVTCSCCWERRGHGMCGSGTNVQTRVASGAHPFIAPQLMPPLAGLPPLVQLTFCGFGSWRGASDRRVTWSRRMRATNCNWSVAIHAHMNRTHNPLLLPPYLLIPSSVPDSAAPSHAHAHVHTHVRLSRGWAASCTR